MNAQLVQKIKTLTQIVTEILVIYSLFPLWACPYMSNHIQLKCPTGCKKLRQILNILQKY